MIAIRSATVVDVPLILRFIRGLAAYEQLLHKLQDHYPEMPQELRSDILAFYHDLDAPISTKTDGSDWAKVLKELDQLQAVDADLRHPMVGAPLPSSDDK